MENGFQFVDVEGMVIHVPIDGQGDPLRPSSFVVRAARRSRSNGEIHERIFAQSKEEPFTRELDLREVAPQQLRNIKEGKFSDLERLRDIAAKQDVPHPRAWPDRLGYRRDRTQRPRAQQRSRPAGPRLTLPPYALARFAGPRSRPRPIEAAVPYAARRTGNVAAASFLRRQKS